MRLSIAYNTDSNRDCIFKMVQNSMFLRSKHWDSLSYCYLWQLIGNS